MANSVKVVDNGYKALLKRLLGPQRQASLTVGIHDAEGGAAANSGDATVAEVAAFHEFGLGVPRRSFLADWADENEAQIKADLKKIGEAVVTGKLPSIEVGLERYGLKSVGSIQQRISDGILPELEDATVARKGSSTPLIDTGQLRASITHKVTK